MEHNSKYHHRYLGWTLLIAGILFLFQAIGWISETFPLWQTLLALVGLKMVLFKRNC